MTIGERIKVARTNAGMTQADLARIMGVPYQTIGHWERDASSPKYSSLEKVAKALNISVETLILGNTDSDKSDKDSKDKAMVSAIEKVVKFLGISYDELLKRANFDPACGVKGNIRFSDDGSAGLTLVQLGPGGRDGVLYLPDSLLLSFARLNRKGVEAVCDVADGLTSIVKYQREECCSDSLDPEPPESEYDLLEREYRNCTYPVYTPSRDISVEPFGDDDGDDKSFRPFGD